MDMSTSTKLGGRAALLFPAIPVLGLVIALAGCGGYYAGSYASGPAPVVVAGAGDYVYYPGDEVYYDNATRVYVYRDHDRWVRHPQPPPHFVAGSASVHVDFHDSPERHHAEVIKTYPKTWRSQATAPVHKEAHHEEKAVHERDKDHDHDDR